MENRLKERLTGAAILVALIVLIVPEVFRGQPGVTRASHAPQAPEGTPVRSYTLDLDAAGAPASPPAPVTPPAAAPAAAPVAPAVKAQAKTPARPPAAAPQGSAAASRAARGAAAAARATPHAAAHTTPHAVAHTAAVGAAGWSVQLGLFSKADNATRLAHTAHGKGFAVHVSRSARGLYRVALVGLTDRAAALRALQRLKAAGLPAAIMGPR